MNNAAAIQAQLVDIRNIGHDKCVKLTLHVPAEQATLVLKAFGWPTAVDPVPVALARLTQPKENEAQPRPPLTESPSSAGGAQHRRPFTSLPLPQQAALLCADPVFRAFLHEEFGFPPDDDEKSAAETLRLRYGINSRSEIKPDSHAGVSFIKDREQFMAWKLVSA